MLGRGETHPGTIAAACGHSLTKEAQPYHWYEDSQRWQQHEDLSPSTLRVPHLPVMKWMGSGVRSQCLSQLVVLILPP